MNEIFFCMNLNVVCAVCVCVRLLFSYFMYIYHANNSVVVELYIIEERERRRKRHVRHESNKHMRYSLSLF